MGRKNTRYQALVGKHAGLSSHPIFFFAVFFPHRLRYLFALHAALPICINLESDRIIILAIATPALPATLAACAIAGVTTGWFNQPSIVMLTTITEMLNRRLDSN
ncbi:unnamed protein product [Lasius platythorax]|uniref:Uncharacterized protein n=1 Tax=Lasius platythorax TaxID=488582 RepID=A0AAV2P336_9HYME